MESLLQIKRPETRKWLCSAASVVGFTFAWAFVLSGAAGLFWGLFTFPTSTRSRPLVMIIGDSITQYASNPTLEGWAAELQYNYVRSIDVENRGLSGWNTTQFINDGLPIIVSELEANTKPAAITLWFGANDAALANGSDASRHVPIDTYRDNLQLIIRRFQEVTPTSKLLVISPPTVDDDVRRQRQVAAGGASDPIDRMNAETGKYAAVCGEVATSIDGVTYLDMYSYLMEAYPNATERGGLLVDGLHMNVTGNRVVYEQVKSKLESMLTSTTLRTPEIADP